MKCQHCGSDDIIAIQGENFCLNCGTIVKAPRPLKEEVEAVKTIAVNKKSGSSQSKAIKPNNTSASYMSAAPAQQSKLSATDRFAHEQPPSQDTDTKVHPLRFALRVAVSLAVVIGIAVGAVVWLQVDNDTVLYIGAAGVVALFITLTLAQSALMYGFSRKYDKRPASHDLWWSAARGGFFDIMNVNLIGLIGFLLLLGIDVACWVAITQHLTLPLPLEIILLVVVNAIAIWMMLGSYVAKRLAVPAVTVAGMTATQALTIGWKFYLKAGGHLVAASLEILVVRIIMLVIIGTLLYAAIAADMKLGTMTAIVAGLFAALMCFIAAMSLLEIEMRLWMRQYRRWASMMPAALRVRLTTGRLQPPK